VLGRRDEQGESARVRLQSNNQYGPYPLPASGRKSRTTDQFLFNKRCVLHGIRVGSLDWGIVRPETAFSQLETAMTLPNFFIVGAPKAGTDELYYDLHQHPEIYMSPLKEPCYFSSEIRPRNFQASLRPQFEMVAASTRRYLDEGARHKRFGGIVSDPNDYQLLFLGVKGQKAIGEASVCYLWSKAAPAAIASSIPHARIIIILMDPAERAFQQYLKSVSDGTVHHSFRKHLEAAMQHSAELGVYHPFLEFGSYFKQVTRYMQLFPPHQVNISIYEDTLSDHQGWFSRVLSFLEVQNTFVPGPVEVPSKPHVPRFVGISHALRIRGLKRIAGRAVPSRFKSFAKQLAAGDGRLPELRPEDRAILVDYYRDDVLMLQDLIGRDLSDWLR
jgi:hypothetical protein